ncbi:flippase-like domain-containing protein [bacterium]|nr:flippase-like domain-containing protein [bacterium]
MSKTIKFFIALTIGILLFIAVIKYIGSNSLIDSFVFILSLKGVVIVLLSLLIAVIGIWKWQLILKSENENFKFRDLAGLWLLGYAVSFITPVALIGGEAFRIYFCKKKLNLKWEKGGASVLIDKISDATLYLFFLTIGFLLFLFNSYLSSEYFVLIASLVIGGLLSLLAIFYLKAMRNESMLQWFMKIFNIKEQNIKDMAKGSNIVFDAERKIMRFFMPNKLAFWKVIGLTSLKYFLFYLRIAFLFAFLKGSFSLSGSLALYGIINMALIVPLPATMGSLDFAGVFVFKSLSLNPAFGVVFSIALRSADIFISVLGFIFLIKYWIDVFGQKLLKLINGFKFKDD